jgi:hypothetical protein
MGEHGANYTGHVAVREFSNHAQPLDLSD